MSYNAFVTGNESKEDKYAILAAKDAAKMASKYNKPRFSGFCDLRTATLIINAVKKEVLVKDFGGYPHAERVVLGYFPWDYNVENELFPITLIEIKNNSKTSMTHRDYLGAVLALGISRGQVGDIKVLENRAYMFVIDSMAQFIMQNLTKVGNQGVTLQQRPLEQGESIEQKFEEITGTISSLRLDCVLALALNTSRANVVQLISAQKVMLNYETTVKADKNVSEGDYISIRGYGKFRLDNIGGTSRKNRQYVTILKYA